MPSQLQLLQKGSKRGKVLAELEDLGFFTFVWAELGTASVSASIPPRGASASVTTSLLVTGIHLPNEASITNAYDSLARLTQTTLNNYGGHPLDGQAYQYDPLGLRTGITCYFGHTFGKPCAMRLKLVRKSRQMEILSIPIRDRRSLATMIWGQVPGNEFRTEAANAEQQGLSQQQFNDQMNVPDLYQIEDPSVNRSHLYEQKKWPQRVSSGKLDPGKCRGSSCASP